MGQALLPSTTAPEDHMGAVLIVAVKGAHSLL